MEGVHQIAVRILTLTWIFSSSFHRNFDIFLDKPLKMHSHGLNQSPQTKKHTCKVCFFVISVANTIDWSALARSASYYLYARTAILYAHLKHKSRQVHVSYYKPHNWYCFLLFWSENQSA